MMKRKQISPASTSVVIDRLLTSFCRGGGAGRYSRRHPHQPLTPSTRISGDYQTMCTVTDNPADVLNEHDSEKSGRWGLM
jgi:hypothetical protein